MSDSMAVEPSGGESPDDLQLVLLSIEHLRRWLESGTLVLAPELPPYEGEPLSGPLRAAVETKVRNMERDPNNEKWYSYYAMVAGGRIVGLIGPKGKEQLPERVEIGYGVSEKYQCRGYATAAVRHLCARYTKREGIRAVVAHTAAENTPSQRVLQKAGFRRMGEESGEVIWEYRP